MAQVFADAGYKLSRQYEDGLLVDALPGRAALLAALIDELLTDGMMDRGRQQGESYDG